MKDADAIDRKARELEDRLIHPPKRLPQYAQQQIAARVEALRWVLDQRDDDPILGYTPGELAERTKHDPDTT